MTPENGVSPDRVDYLPPHSDGHAVITKIIGYHKEGVPKGTEFQYLLRRRKVAAGLVAEPALDAPPTLEPGPACPQARAPIGLAFSGGGIRSGAFNLGVVQGLARYGVLPWVDYLTSVSGGGFSAAAMISMLSKKREDGTFYFHVDWPRFPFNPDIRVFAPLPKKGQEKPQEKEQAAPFDRSRYRGVSLEPDPAGNAQLDYFRKKSNYLAPRLGVLTRDVLRTVGGLFPRMGYTLFLFLAAWLALASLHYLMTAALTPSIARQMDVSAVFAPAATPAPSEAPPAWTLSGLVFGNYAVLPETPAPQAEGLEVPVHLYALAALFGALFSMAFTWLLNAALRGVLEEYAGGQGEGASTAKTQSEWDVQTATRRLRRWSDACYGALFAAAALTAALYWETARQGGSVATFYWVWIWGGVLGLVLGGYYLGVVRRMFGDERWILGGLPSDYHFNVLFLYVYGGLMSGFGMMTVVWLRLPSLAGGLWGSPGIFWLWMVPVFFLGCLLGVGIFRVFDVHPRSRPGASIWGSIPFRSITWANQGLTIYALAGALVMGALILPRYFAPWKGTSESVALAAALISGAYASYLARLGKSEGGENMLIKIIRLPDDLRNLVLGLLVVVLNLSVVFFFEGLLDGWQPGNPLTAAAVGVGAAVAVYIAGRQVNFNYTSLHYFYRDRLSDAFLKTEIEDDSGAVHTVRDDRYFRMHKVNPDGSSAPYHIVQAALNMPGTWHLRYKDRKARHFIFSRHFTGSDVTGYVRTSLYRNGLTKYSRTIAVSAAAVGSGMGFHTFFAQAFVTTLLNLRLGLWMLNPSRYAQVADKDGHLPPSDSQVLREVLIRHERRVFWPAYLWDELRGRLSERKALVNLSDGAFPKDNLALYPLFQRRCRLIIAGDASQDAAGHCESLFQVLQLARDDLGIEVDLDVRALKLLEEPAEGRRQGWSQHHVAVGRIRYPQKFGLKASQGWLLYIKPTVTGDEPASIVQYWETHQDDFPHPSTGDQFYDDEQYEAQRYLGEVSVAHMVDDLLAYFEAQARECRAVEKRLAKVERALAAQQEPPSGGGQAPKEGCGGYGAYLRQRRKDLLLRLEGLRAAAPKHAALKDWLKQEGAPAPWSALVGPQGAFAGLDDFMETLQKATAPAG